MWCISTKRRVVQPALTWDRTRHWLVSSKFFQRRPQIDLALPFPREQSYPQTSVYRDSATFNSLTHFVLSETTKLNHSLSTVIRPHDVSCSPMLRPLKFRLHADSDIGVLVRMANVLKNVVNTFGQGPTVTKRLQGKSKTSTHQEWKSEAEITGFALFRAHEAPLVVSLTVEFSSLDDEWTRPIARAISHLTALQDLTLRKPEPWMEARPEILDAFIALKSIKRLRVTGAAAGSMELVTRTESRLEYLHVERGRSSEPFYASIVLQKHRHTLRELYVTPGCMTIPEDDDSDNEEKMDVDQASRLDRGVANEETFPKDGVMSQVTHLHIPGCSLAELSGFMEGFPNVKFLDVGAVMKRFDEELEIWRIDNKIATRCLAANTERVKNPSRRPWRNLNVVRGGLIELYTMGNTCSVDILEVLGPIGEYAELLAHVIEDHCPRVLRVSFEVPLRADDVVNPAERDRLASIQAMTVKLLVKSDLASCTSTEESLLVSYINDYSDRMDDLLTVDLHRPLCAVFAKLSRRSATSSLTLLSRRTKTLCRASKAST